MSRPCARKSPRTPRPRASESSAARPTTARGERSRSSAGPGLARRPPAPRPKRGRSAQGVRTLTSAANVHSNRPAARVGATPSAPSPSRPDPSRLSGAAPPEGANGRRVRTRRSLDAGPRGRTPRGLKGPRASAASSAPQREATAIVMSAPRERATAPNGRASASLTGLRAGRAPRPAKAAAAIG